MSDTNKDRNKKLGTQVLLEDTRWKMKGGAHKAPLPTPLPCPDCKGMGRNTMGVECFRCEGLGEVYE